MQPDRIRLRINPKNVSVPAGFADLYVDKDGKIAVETSGGKVGSPTTGLKPSDVGLGNVDNTSDANKPVSTAQQTALNAKVNLAGNASISGVKTFTGNASFGVKVLTFGTSIAWDLATGNLATVTLTGNATLANPTNVTPGTYIVRVTQDAVGAKTLAYGTNFKFPGGTAPVLSTVANAVDILTFINFGGTQLYLVAQKQFA